MGLGDEGRGGYLGDLARGTGGNGNNGRTLVKGRVDKAVVGGRFEPVINNMVQGRLFVLDYR